MYTGPSHWTPWKVNAAHLVASYRFYDADEMQLVEDGNIDWCCLQDCCNDEYKIMLDDEYVKAGFIDVDRPQREGRGMFLASHHSELFINEALPASRAGLWWHVQSRTPDFEKSLVEWTKRFNRSMSEIEREQIHQHVITWRGMFPGDDRVEEFHTDFVLDMLTRARVIRKDSMGKSEVWFERVRT
jgi:hypothetical protein